MLAAGLLAGALAPLAGLLLACGGPPPEPWEGLEALEARVFTDAAVLCVPGGRWKRSESAWSFQGSATVLVYVDREAPALDLFFRPSASSRDEAFEAEWDDQAMSFEPRQGPSAPLHLTIPETLRAPGQHRLRLRRVGADDAAHRRGAPWTHLDEIGCRAGDDEARLRSGERGQVLLGFLETGLTGVGAEKLSGFLFDGPREVVARLSAGDDARLSLVAENLSNAAAVFFMRAGAETLEATLPPRGRGELSLPLPPGSGSVMFRVEGERDGLYLWGMPHVSGAKTRELPPIVLISLDTTRRDALGPFGGGETVTPHLSAFAQRAVAFERAFATAPWTLPSHGSMFTGLPPSEHELGVLGRRFRDGVVPLPELLRERGYLTAGFAGGRLSASQFGIARGFHLYRDPDDAETRGDDLTEQVKAFLEGHPERPLFLFINYFDPHGMYQAPSKIETRLGVPEARAALQGQPGWEAVAQGDPRAWSRLLAGELELTTEGLAYLRAAYLAEVAFMDEQLGRLFDILERQGLFDPALIVVVADHGEALGERGYLTHSKRLDPAIVEIPLLVKWPHQSRPLRVATPVSGVDVFPTVLEVAGVEVPDGRGVPLGAQHRGRLQSRPHVLMEEHASALHPIEGFGALGTHVFGIQEPAARLVIWRDGAECASAPLWAPGPCEGGWEAALARVREVFPNIPEVPAPSEATALSPQEEENLRALGYLPPDPSSERDPAPVPPGD